MFARYGSRTSKRLHYFRQAFTKVEKRSLVWKINEQITFVAVLVVSVQFVQPNRVPLKVPYCTHFQIFTFHPWLRCSGLARLIIEIKLYVDLQKTAFLNVNAVDIDSHSKCTVPDVRV